MRTTISTAEGTYPTSDFCRYFDSARCHCRATLSQPLPREHKVRVVCTTDEHDRCPLFLAKLLGEEQSMRQQKLATNPFPV